MQCPLFWGRSPPLSFRFVLLRLQAWYIVAVFLWEWVFSVSWIKYFLPKCSLQFPTFMQFHLRNQCQFSWLYGLGDNAIMCWSILDRDIFRATEIAFKFNDLKILNIEREEIGLLLVNHCKFLTNFDTGKELLYLLFVQLHTIIKIITRTSLGKDNLSKSRKIDQRW